MLSTWIDYSLLKQPLVRLGYKEKGKNFDADQAYTNDMLGNLARIYESESALIDNFVGSVKAGNIALNKKDCPLAKTNYEKAIKLLPGEKYPLDQLSKAEICIKEKGEEALAKQKAEQEAKAKADADKLAKETTDKEAKAKAEQETLAKQKAEQEAKAKADADKLAKETADKAAKAKAEQETLAKQKVAQEAKAKADADKLAKAKAEQEKITKLEADKLAKLKAEQAAKAKIEAEQLAKLKAEQEANAKLAAEKAAKESVVKKEEEPKDNGLQGTSTSDGTSAGVKGGSSSQIIPQTLGSNTKYKETIKRADELLKMKRYTEAKPMYEEALKYKPNDTYASSKLTEVESKLAEKK